ncbi:MAG: hypothetical protein KF802_07830 [Bdellovibrionaceae bacterium]|nr:hypothetical protein [Pseudobdellovibrionaceae bacterium]
MNNQNETQKAQAQQAQGFFTNPQVYLNTERGVLTHRIGNDLRIDMPINLYKSILGFPFEKKTQTDSSEEKAPSRPVFGLVARPAIYLSKDGNYLIHRVLDTRISKHVNYYKRIFQNAETSASAEALPA